MGKNSVQVQHLLHLHSPERCLLSVEYLRERIFILCGSVLLLASVLHYPNGRNLYLSLWEKAGIWFPFPPREQDRQIKEGNVFEQQPELHTIRGKVKCFPFLSSPCLTSDLPSCAAVIPVLPYF